MVAGTLIQLCQIECQSCKMIIWGTLQIGQKFRVETLKCCKYSKKTSCREIDDNF